MANLMNRDEPFHMGQMNLELYKLLAVGTDPDECMNTVLSLIRCLPGVDRVCVVPFVSRDGKRIFCDTTESCALCWHNYDLERVALRLLPNPPYALGPETVRSAMMDDMPPSFMERDTSLTPLLYEGKIIGVIFCCTNEKFDDDSRASFSSICELITIALQNVSYYEQHTVQEKMLRDAVKLAEDASRAKSEFLSRMSHELRTPINAILGLARIASIASSPEKTGEYLQTIDKSASQLLAVVNDLLDMSDLESNLVTLRSKQFNLEETLLSLAADIAPKASAKRLKLHLHLNTDVPFRLVGDEQRIRQILKNLLDNAVKFTPAGGKVLLQIREAERYRNNTTISFSVTDTGIGISDEAQKMLFTPFEQVDGSKTRAFDGSGLGLALSKKLTDLMGGTLSVKSIPTQGSTFVLRVTLPFTEPPAERRTVAAGYDLSKQTVLIAEKEPETVSYFLRCMKDFKVRTDSAASFAECLGKLQNADAMGRPYSGIFLGETLAGSNTMTMLQSIRDWYAGSIILLRPNMQTDIDESPPARYNVMKLLSTPFLPSTLFDTVLELSRVNPRAKRFAAALQLYAGYHILLAEDNLLNREVIAQTLADTQVTLHYAVNGQDALDMFAADPGLFDLILMDRNMPVMDGYEAARRIRMLPLAQAETIPIIALTANKTDEDIYESRLAGMNEHLTKPVEPEQVLALLQRYFTQETNTKKAEDPTVPPADEKENESMSTYEPPVAYVNVAEGLGRIKGNQRIYKMLMTSFLNNEQYAAFEKDMTQNNIESAVKTIHAVKGIAANLSLTKLYEDVLVMEAQLKSGYFMPDAYDNVQNAYQTTFEHVQKLVDTL